MIFAIILLVSLLLRISRFDFPASYTFAWGDGTRDFLVASHVLKYHELILVGPFNLLNDAGIHNSPIYFYILSLFLIPFNNILTLSFVNILLQLGVIVLIYKLVKKIFDYPTALIAVLLFSFNPEIIKQADFIWQPYLALPIALLGLYYSSRPFIGLALVVFATSIHYSIFPWLPLFFLRRNPFKKRNIKFYVGASLVTIFSLIIFYLPLIVFYLKNGLPNILVSSSIYINSVSGYFSNVYYNIKQLLDAFYLTNVLVLILTAGFFISLKRDSKHIKTLIFFLLLFILPIIFASFFNKIRLHYLILSVALLPIIVAKISAIFKPMLRNITVLALIVIFSGNFSYFKQEAKNPLDNQRRVDQITSKVLEELDSVKNTDGFSGYDFFQVRSYAVSEVTIPYPVLDTFLLVPLEERLGNKLAKVSDQSPYNHFQENRKEYLLISCYKFVKEMYDCTDNFKHHFQDYNILKMIYNDESISVYVAKNIKI